jgi:hypothetical protein
MEIEYAVPLENGEFATVGSDGNFRFGNRLIKDVSGFVPFPVRDGFSFCLSESHCLILFFTF